MSVEYCSQFSISLQLTVAYRTCTEAYIGDRRGAIDNMRCHQFSGWFARRIFVARKRVYYIGVEDTRYLWIYLVYAVEGKKNLHFDARGSNYERAHHSSLVHSLLLLQSPSLRTQLWPKCRRPVALYYLGSSSGRVFKNIVMGRAGPGRVISNVMGRAGPSRSV